MEVSRAFAAMLTGSVNVDITSSLPVRDLEFMQHTEEPCSTQRQSVYANGREYGREEGGAVLDNVHLPSDPQYIGNRNSPWHYFTDSESIIFSPPSFTTEPPSALASTPGPSLNHHTDSGLRFLPTAIQENWQNCIVDVPPAYIEE